MKFLKFCERICIVLDMLVLLQIFGTSTTYIPSRITWSFWSVWAYVCSVKYVGVKTNIWHYHHAHSQWTHMKFLKCCGCICVVLDMVVLRPIFGTSTTHIPNFHLLEVFPLMWEALWSCGKCKFSPQDVFSLIWEAMWWSGKCKFSPQEVFFLCG